MTTFTQKYAIISPIVAVHEGDTFASSGWPLHVTLADTFAVDWDRNDLMQNLRTLFATAKSIPITAMEDTYFGDSQQTQVTLLQPNDQLCRLHNELIKLLESSGAVFNDPQFTKEGFRPHATVQAHTRLYTGQHIQLTNIAIVDMFPGNDAYQRRILQTFTLLNR